MAEGKGKPRSAGLRGVAEQIEAKLERRGLRKGTAAFKKAFSAESSGMISAYGRRVSKSGYKGEGARTRAELKDSENRKKARGKASERASMRPDKVGSPRRPRRAGGPS